MANEKFEKIKLDEKFDVFESLDLFKLAHKAVVQNLSPYAISAL